MARPIHPVVVGTAGHIDHGKSSLVKALTGIDPDRLKEEQERGLTIDLGFARLKLADGRWLGMVDVPGHERFVRNMVAGCTGLGLAILVVAADDGVMPQTIEHKEILDLLEVRGGLVALTKIDMVDPLLADMAEEEIRKLLRGSVLDGAPICRVSSVTGEGLPELRQQIETMALLVAPRSCTGPFRMPVQRVFSLPGIGTVITGIPQSGSIVPGTEIEILPIGVRFKVRGLHAYGGKVEAAVAGHGTALSVPDAKESGIHRGMVVVTPGAFGSGDAVDLALKITRRAPVLHHREPIRFHTGTIEVRGELLLLDRDFLSAEQAATVRVELDADVCCSQGDHFLLRLQNPAMTIGGGRVLRLAKSGRYRRKDLGVELQAILAAGNRPEARIEHELQRAAAEGCTIDDLAHVLETEERKVLDVIRAMPQVHLHERAMRAFRLVDIAAGEHELLASVERMLARRAAAASIKRAALRATKTLPEPMLDAVLDLLQSSGRVRKGSQGLLLFADRLKPLPALQQQRLSAMVIECQKRGFRPPDQAELEAAVGLTGEAMGGLLERGQDEAQLEKVGEHYYATPVIRMAMHAIRDNCLAHAEVLDIPALRDALQTSRKYLIPLLEHVDAIGLTVLRGGARRLLVSSDVNRALAMEADAR